MAFLFRGIVRLSCFILLHLHAYNMKNYSESLIQGKPDMRDRVRNRITAIGLFEIIRKRPFTTRKQGKSQYRDNNKGT